jgi:hypothetical protein
MVPSLAHHRSRYGTQPRQGPNHPPLLPNKPIEQGGAQKDDVSLATIHTTATTATSKGYHGFVLFGDDLPDRGLPEGLQNWLLARYPLGTVIPPPSEIQDAILTNAQYRGTYLPGLVGGRVLKDRLCNFVDGERMKRNRLHLPTNVAAAG